MKVKIVIEYDNDEGTNDLREEWKEWKDFNVDMVDIVRTGGKVTFSNEKESLEITEEMT